MLYVLQGSIDDLHDFIMFMWFSLPLLEDNKN